jgi:signal transduction histidine kinase
VVIAGAEDIELAPSVATELFRMFQEIMSNIEKHARAQRVEVRVTPKGNGLVLSVSDDGIGISRAMLTSSRSLGLLELREKALNLGGQVEVSSAPKSGTKVIITVPRTGLLQDKEEPPNDSCL